MSRPRFELGISQIQVGSKRSVVRVRAAARVFSLLQNVRTDSGAQPASYFVETWGSFLEVKRPKRHVDHSPPPSAEVKNE